jgi:hypothetical protein
MLAEVASFPLASIEALKHPSMALSLDPDFKSEESKELWRQAEKKFVKQFPDVSIDEIIFVRDLLWFHDENYSVKDHPVSLSSYLYHLTSRCLKIEGSTARPDIFRYFRLKNSYQSTLTEKNQSRTFWRWITLALPQDLLMAGFSLKGKKTSTVDTVSPLLKRVLKDKEFAETHLHLGAAIDFPLFWISAQNVLADSEIKPDFLHSPGAQFNEGKDLGFWLIHCFLARYILAMFLANHRKGFSGFFENLLEKECLKLFGLCNASLLLKALKSFTCGQIQPSGLMEFRALQRMFASLTGILAKPSPKNLDEMKTYDPVNDFMHIKTVNSEICFVSNALKYIDHQKKDHFFARMFWQVIRVRCLFYRYIVQRPMTPGLQWFFRFYERIRSLRKPLSTSVLVQKALNLSGHETGLKSLEVRCSLTNQSMDIVNGVKDAASAARNIAKDIEFAVVFHITRDRGGGSRKGIQQPQEKQSFADPHSRKGNVFGYRYSSYYLKRRTEVLALGRTLQYFPFCNFFIRGIDACSDEIGIPHWVLVPLFKYVRDSGSIGSKIIFELTGQTLPPLRKTIHLGEDFIHLLGGLRRVDQAVDFLELKEGDRIGHGLTLGIDAIEWAERKRYVLLPKEERLFDMVWEWSWYATNNGGSLDHQRCIYLDKEICRLSFDIFRKKLTPFQLYQFVRELHNEKILRACGFPDRTMQKDLLRQREQTNPSEQFNPAFLVYQYLTCSKIYKRGRELELIDTQSEGKIIDDLQSGLRAKIANLGITVEVNPSSNLLIGNFGDLDHHPFWRLNSPKSDPDKSISIVIGSDDPLIFATDLPSEYQFLRDTLVNANISDDQTMKWLDKVRNKGLESRFTDDQAIKWFHHERTKGLISQLTGVSSGNAYDLIKRPFISDDKLTLPP